MRAWFTAIGHRAGWRPDVARRRDVAARLALGAHAQAGPPAARRLAATLGELTEREHAGGIEILFPRYTGGGRTEPVERRLLPVPALADAVLAEWVIGEPVHATVEALASEIAAGVPAQESP